MKSAKKRIKDILTMGAMALDKMQSLDDAMMAQYDQEEAVRAFQAAGAPERIAVLLAVKISIGTAVLQHVEASRAEGRL